MAAYKLILVKVHDPEGFAAFSEVGRAAMERCGGELVFRSDECVTVLNEGLDTDCLIIQKFPDVASARAARDDAEHREARAKYASAFTRHVIVGS